jgi:hypothetical protein
MFDPMEAGKGDRPMPCPPIVTAASDIAAVPAG